MLSAAQWFQVMSKEAVRAAVAAAVETAVRDRIHQELAPLPMCAEQSRALEARLFDIMYPVAMEEAMQHCMDAGMQSQALRVRVVKSPARGCMAARYLVGVKAADARTAGL